MISPPKLISIDLTKKSFIVDGRTVETENTNYHPDIKTDGTQYLVKYDGRYFCGSFNKVWFGINFSGWYNHLQYDKPGTNGSKWEGVWEIKE